MTFDEICETLDELGISGDTPFRVKFEDQFFEVAAIHGPSHSGDGTVIIELEEAETV